jgi:hypothetical protein
MTMSKLCWGALLVLLRVWAVICTRVTIVSPDGDRAPYLIRWHVWPGLYLHKFVSSDPDRGWHCHPWEWASSRILDGVYYQSVPPGWGLPCHAPEGVYRAGDVNQLLEGDYHRVLLVTPIVWTLFRHGPKHGHSWNFLSYDMETITAPREVDAPQVRRGLVHFA